MKQIIISVFCILSYAFSFGQVDRIQIADSISKEGKKLYRSEMASWYGTDVFMEKFKSESNNIGGYFSYPNEGKETCLFFSKGENPQVLGTISFTNSYDPSKAQVDDRKREFTSLELDYYLLRKAAFTQVNSDTSFFRTYKSTSLNLIPLIENNKKQVYILTGTSRTDIVIIGNDYLLNFDKDNKLISKRKLHANIIPLQTKVEEEKEEGKITMGSVHNHLPETGDYITATDVCTFMLYEKFTNWKQQMVISEKYMSIWMCETDNLLIVPTGN